MISDYRCFYCFARAFEKLIEKENISIEAKNNFTLDMTELYGKHHGCFSAPAFSRELHVILKRYTGNADPYLSEKRASNDFVLARYDSLKEMVVSSDDQFNTALRLAIAGNIIDFAIHDSFDLDKTINHVLTSQLAIDHTLGLKQALLDAKTVLYLGDNAGEIVFDKILIETMGHPDVYFVVRGAPVINDATIDDAVYVGMDRVAKVISNGYDAPSTILENCSAQFQSLFEKADVIISKGQGNLEGLLGKTNKKVFFLLMVKCDVIAHVLGVKKGDFVVKMNHEKTV